MTGQLGHDDLAQIVYRDDPVLLLFGQSEAGLCRARAAAEAAGHRVGGEALLAEAAARLDQQIYLDGVIVVAEQPARALDDLLIRVQADAQAGRIAVAINAPETMIDAVSGLLFVPGVHYVIGDDPDDLARAVARLPVRSPTSTLHDSAREPATDVLQELIEDAARLASRLATLSVKGVELKEGEATASGDSEQLSASFVRSVIRARRLRDQFWRGELFADPAWDMLLDLYAARLEGNRVAVSSLCIAAAVPATTALRWIKALTDRGLLVRSADPQDGRRVYIELAEDAAKAMAAYLSMARRVTPIIT